MSEARVGGVVLAAGAAARMGQAKQNLGFGDTTVVGWSIRNAEASSLDDVVVVTGAHELEDLELDRARIVHNPDHSDGSITSLRTGIEALGDVDAAVVLLGDSPEVDPPIIDTIVEDWRKLRPWASVAEYHDGVGHPYVLSRAVFPLLAGLSGDKPLFRFLGEHSDEVRLVMVPQLRPQDINTWQDYVEAHESFGFGTPQEA